MASMSFIEQLSGWAPTPWMSLLLASAIYLILLCTYRLFLHPLAAFPGPTFAAITHWYEFYYDFFFPGGQYIFVIREMHLKYGPVVRISPHELHVNELSFLPELMPAGGRRRDKYARISRIFGGSRAAANTLNHDLHRVRRGAMSKIFSKESVRRLEPIMTEMIQKLYGRLKGFQETAEPINLLPMFGAFTNDLISEYTYGLSLDWLDAPSFNQPFFDMMHGMHKTGPLVIRFAWFMPLLSAIPQWLSLKMNPGLSSFIHWKKEIAKKIDTIAKEHQEGEKSRTVFDEILDSNIPDVDKEPERLLDEARMITIAGTEPLSWVLSVLTFHLLSNRAVLSKLRAELRLALPDANAYPSLKDMEQLPYLSAVISEGLRIAMGTANRQTRICPNKSMVFDDGDRQWHIPADTPVGIATPLVHLNPRLFPDPFTFEPERFIANPQLKQSLLSFSRGSRQCLGIHIAYAQLYLLLAGIWRQFSGSEEEKGELGWWELFETDKTDVEMHSALFVPYPKTGSKGIRVVIHS